MVDAGVGLEPGPGGHAVVTGQVFVGDPDLPVLVGVLEQLQELLIDTLSRDDAVIVTAWPSAGRRPP